MDASDIVASPPQIRKSTRQHKPPSYLHEFHCKIAQSMTDFHLISSGFHLLFLLQLNLITISKLSLILDGLKLCNLNFLLWIHHIHGEWYPYLMERNQLLVGGSIKSNMTQWKDSRQDWLQRGTHKRKVMIFLIHFLLHSKVSSSSCSHSQLVSLPNGCEQCLFV